MAKYQPFNHKSPGLHMFYRRTTCSYDFIFESHTAVELYCFLDGKATYYIEGTKYDLQPGDLLLIRPGEMHMISVDFSVPYERACAIFNEALFSQLLGNDTLMEPFWNRDPGFKNLYRPSDFGRDVSRYYFSKMRQAAPDERLNILANILSLLQQVGIAFRQNQFTETTAHPTAQRILQYINTHLHEDLSVKALCKEFFISSAQLNRVFKSATNCPVSRYIESKRLFLAQQMIHEGMTLTNVSLQCGYSSYSTFYRAYQKHFGRTPKQEQTYEFWNEHTDPQA